MSLFIFHLPVAIWTLIGRKSAAPLLAREIFRKKVTYMPKIAYTKYLVSLEAWSSWQSIQDCGVNLGCEMVVTYSIIVRECVDSNTENTAANQFCPGGIGNKTMPCSVNCEAGTG